MVVDPVSRLAYAVMVLSNSLTQQIERALRPLELTQSQLAALVQLAVGPEEGLSGADISRLAGLTPQSMSTALARLEARALVVRSPHPTRGRVVVVRITPAGRRLAEQAQEMCKPVDARALALLSPQEREDLHALLRRVMDALGFPQQTADVGRRH